MTATLSDADRNKRVQNRYDELMHAGKHGHYETLFQVVREEVESASRARQGLETAGWQPIETAPRDAKPVDLWVRSGFWNADGEWQVVAEFRLSDARWVLDRWVNIGGNEFDEFYDFKGLEATHWAPVPKPPLQGGRET